MPAANLRILARFYHWWQVMLGLTWLSVEEPIAFLQFQTKDTQDPKIWWRAKHTWGPCYSPKWSKASANPNSSVWVESLARQSDLGLVAGMGEQPPRPVSSLKRFFGWFWLSGVMTVANDVCHYLNVTYHFFYLHHQDLSASAIGLLACPSCANITLFHGLQVD